MIWAWWYTPIIPALRRLRKEAPEFEASMSYTGRPCLQQTNKQQGNDVMSHSNIFCEDVFTLAMLF
jgi:hypothetical protein